MSKERLAQHHRSTGFLLEPFRDPNKCYELFVHGLGKTKVFFQIGMIIENTVVPEPKKIRKGDIQEEKHDKSGGEELPITDDDTRSEQQRYLLSFERIARFINAHLERQSDRYIPKTSYRAGLTALKKMSGQEISRLCQVY